MKYSYSTLSNYPNTQHSQGNEFASTIGTHQRSLRNRSGNDAISGDYSRYHVDRPQHDRLNLVVCLVLSVMEPHADELNAVPKPTHHLSSSLDAVEVNDQLWLPRKAAVC